MIMPKQSDNYGDLCETFGNYGDLWNNLTEHKTFAWRLLIVSCYKNVATKRLRSFDYKVARTQWGMGLHP